MVKPGARVTLHFSLTLPDGTLIDSNYNHQPATFTVGDGSLLPGFEAALSGYGPDDSVRVRLSPDQAFGAVNPANIQTFPRERFARLLANSTDPVIPGTVLAFADGAGNDIPGVVKSIDDELMTVDFNHPLAGREIDFAADIISVVAPGVEVVEVR